MVKSRNLCDFSDGVRVECGVVWVWSSRNLFINMVVECGVVWLGELGKSVKVGLVIKVGLYIIQIIPR